MAKLAGRSTQRLRGQHNMMLATVSADANYFTTTPPKQIHTWLRGLCGTRRHGRAQEHQYQSWYRSTTPSGECMDGTQQLQSTNPYLREQLQLWDAVVGRGFTTSSEDMESIQQLRSATTVYLWQQVSYQTRYITSRLGCQVVQHNRIARTSLHTASHTLSWGCTQWRQQYDCKRRAQEQ